MTVAFVANIITLIIINITIALTNDVSKAPNDQYNKGNDVAIKILEVYSFCPNKILSLPVKNTVVKPKNIDK